MMFIPIGPFTIIYMYMGQYFTIVKTHVASTKSAFGIIIRARSVNSTRFFGRLYHLKIKKTSQLLSNILLIDQQAFISLIYQFWRVANDQSE